MALLSMKHEPDSANSKQCPVGMDLAALGKKWTFHILRDIGVLQIDRFNQIIRSLPGLTPRVLIMRLNELEKSALIRPVIVRERPRLVRWVLTEKGKDTLPILEGYSSFVSKWYPNASLRNHRPQIVKVPGILDLVERYKQGTIGNAQKPKQENYQQTDFIEPTIRAARADSPWNYVM